MPNTIPKSILAICLTLLAAPVGALAAEAPATAVEVLHSRINAHEVEASADVFEDDAVVIQPRVGGLPQIYVGREQIRWWLRQLVAQHVVLGEPVEESSGAELTGSATLSIDVLRQIGVPAVETQWRATLAEDGRIRSLTTVLTPEGARRLQEAPVTEAPVTAMSVELEAPAGQAAMSAAALVSLGFGAGAATMVALGRRRGRPATGVARLVPRPD